MSGSMTPLAGDQKRRICYFFDSDIGNYHYGPGHPMKPHRIRMTHALVMNYGLYKKMEIFRAKPATRKEMAQFHTDDYVEFLSKVTPDNMDGFMKEQSKFNLGDDCPVFDGLFEYCSISAGGSMEGAARLSRDKCDIAVNWAGGLHHAKKAEANGFCYVNDIVLGILELLRYHKRVLYVDIDVHHGDGVEEAFYTTDRVMTCSFHKYGEFFPGTGELRDTGHGKGKHYAVNFPLRDGITDESYKNIFEPVIMKIMETYQPSAIVLQCGGDSLSGDRLGSFNVSMRGHANCVQFIKSLGLPLLLLGGGGYTIRNVSRTWAYETGLAAGQELCSEIPMNEYYEYFGPTYRLEVPPSNMEDMNVSQYLEKVKVQIFENLRHTIPVPSVEMQPIPRLSYDEMEVDEDLDDPDDRKPQRLLDGLIQRDDEFSDSEDEGEGGRRDIQSHKRLRDQLDQSPQPNGHKPSPTSAALKPPPRKNRRQGPSDAVRSRNSSASSSTTPNATTNLRPRPNDGASEKLGDIGLGNQNTSPIATRWTNKAVPPADRVDGPLSQADRPVANQLESESVDKSPSVSRSLSGRQSPESSNPTTGSVIPAPTDTAISNIQPDGKHLNPTEKVAEEAIQLDTPDPISHQPAEQPLSNPKPILPITNPQVPSKPEPESTDEDKMDLDVSTTPQSQTQTTEIALTGANPNVEEIDADTEDEKNDSRGESEKLTDQIARFLPGPMEIDVEPPTEKATEPNAEAVQVGIVGAGADSGNGNPESSGAAELEQDGSSIPASASQTEDQKNSALPPASHKSAEIFKEVGTLIGIQPMEPSIGNDSSSATVSADPKVENDRAPPSIAVEVNLSGVVDPEEQQRAELERMAEQLVKEVEREAGQAEESRIGTSAPEVSKNLSNQTIEEATQMQITVAEPERDPRLQLSSNSNKSTFKEVLEIPRGKDDKGSSDDSKKKGGDDSILEKGSQEVNESDLMRRSGVEKASLISTMMDPQLNDSTTLTPTTTSTVAAAATTIASSSVPVLNDQALMTKMRFDEKDERKRPKMVEPLRLGEDSIRPTIKIDNSDGRVEEEKKKRGAELIVIDDERVVDGDGKEKDKDENENERKKKMFLDGASIDPLITSSSTSSSNSSS